MALVQVPAVAPIPASTSTYSSTEQSTTSTTYTNLGTSISLTLTTGTKALVLISARLDDNSTGKTSYVGINVTGASTISPTDGRGLQFRSLSGSNDSTIQAISTGHIYYNTLTAGSNTFTIQLKTASATTFRISSIQLTVVDMGS